MDRRQFMGATAAVGTVAIVPRTFARSLDRPPVQRAAVIRLFDYDKEILKVDTLLDEYRDNEDRAIVYGRGAKILVTSKETFSFNKMTIEVEGLLGKQADLFISKRYTVNTGNTLTLLANPEGFLRLSR